MMSENQTEIKRQKNNGGYIALMATVIISAILLIMVTQESFSGWHARFNVLGTEQKEQAVALSDGCINQAITGLIAGLPYQAGATSTTPGGICHISKITTTTTGVLINTQSEVGNSFSNVGMSIDTGNLAISPSKPEDGMIIVQTTVTNNNKTNSTSSNFTTEIFTNPMSSFRGSFSGVTTYVKPGNYSITENSSNSPSGFAFLYSSDCQGYINPGEIKNCIITNVAVNTTLTLITNVVNKYKGTNQPGDFQLSINGPDGQKNVTTGVPINVDPGQYIATAADINGYLSSPWGYQCDASGTVSVATGDNKTCMIEFDDPPPPNLSCADTIIMLDRTGGSASVLPDESTAASTLVSIYSLVAKPLPLPYLGVGSFGGLDGSTASVPNNSPTGIFGILTTTYSNLITAINKMMGSTSNVGSDLSSGISVGNAALNNSKNPQKVLIFVSDGNPSKPTGNIAASTGFLSPSANAQNDANDTWNNSTNAYTGTDSGADAISTVGSGNSKHQFYNFNFPAIPSGSTISGIEADTDAWVSGNSGSSTSATITPTSAGDYDQWTPHGTTVSYDAVNDTTPDGDSTYIDTSASLDTFNMSTLSLPTGATISSVVLNATAKASSSGAPLQLVAENGTSSSKLYVGSTNTLTNTTSYATTSITLATNPLNSNKAWAVSDINNMDFGVRTTNGSAIPRITQMSVVVNYSIPSVCNLGMDLSYDGGTHWTPSTEKTNTLAASVTTQQFGGSTDTWSRTWAVTDFSNANFRARVHAAGGTGCQSTMTEHLDWLRLKVSYNQTAATAAALTAADTAKLSGTDIFTIYYSSSPNTQDENYLAELANGTTTVPGHQPGAYNVPSGVTTGSVAVLAAATTTPSTWTHPEYAFTTGNNYSTDTVSGHQQGFAGFSFLAGNAVPPTASITGVEIDLQAKSPSSSGCSITAAISTNGGSTYTSSLSTSLTTTGAKTYAIGGSTSLWGRTWASTDFNNLAVQLQDIRGTNCSKSVALSVNSLKAKVYYSVNLQNSAGQNFFIAPTSADIPSIFDFIGNQVCPAARPVQVIPPTTATLLVITNVTNSNSGTKKPSDFTVNVTTPSQSTNSFSGSSSAISLTIYPGDYVVTENPMSGYTEILGDGCSSVAGASSTKIKAGETRTCIITNDDIPPPPPPPDLTITPVLGTWLETSTTP